MRTFQLNSKPFEFDETKKYSDYYVTGQSLQQHLVELQLEALLANLESGEWKWEDVYPEVKLWSRWEVEAPRKRYWRDFIRSGMPVAFTRENFFVDHPQSDHILETLENTGKATAALCRHYGAAVLAPITNLGPDPLGTEELLRE